jgi:glycosyltransferase involved in cell wall biosynthesis
MIPGISVVIPTVAPRTTMLHRALNSVTAQTLQPEVVIVQEDSDRKGAAATRQRAQDSVETEYTCPLDDDDELLPMHTEHLFAEAQRTDADLVFPWYEVHGGGDPMPEAFGRDWEAYLTEFGPYQFPVTFLARTEVIRAAGGWEPMPEGQRLAAQPGEDWRLCLALVAMGAKIVHLPEKTWIWHHHGQNTSGLPERVAWTNG